MRSIKVLGLGLALLLGSLLPVAASAREHTTTSAVVFVAYRDDGHYYRDRDDRRALDLGRDAGASATRTVQVGHDGRAT